MGTSRKFPAKGLIRSLSYKDLTSTLRQPYNKRRTFFTPTSNLRSAEHVIVVTLLPCVPRVPEAMAYRGVPWRFIGQALNMAEDLAVLRSVLAGMQFASA